MKKLLVFALVLFSIGTQLNAQDTEGASIAELKQQLEFLKGKLTPLQEQMQPIQDQADAIQKKLDGMAADGWTYGGDGLLAIDLTVFSDWAAAAGTKRLFGLTGNVNLFANYKKDKFLLENKGAFKLGYTRTVTEAQEFDFIKGIDEIMLSSNANYLITDKLSINGAASFQSQFAPGYNFAETDTFQVSKFAAPAYINAGVGIKYIPNQMVSVTYHPLNYKMTYVNWEQTSAPGDSITTYNLTETNPDLQQVFFGVDAGAGKKSFHTVGSYLNVSFRKDLMKRVSFASTLDVYLSYLTRNLDSDNFFNDRVTANWNNVIGLQINKFLSATLDFTLRREYAENDKWQMRYFQGIGLSAKF